MFDSYRLRVHCLHFLAIHFDEIWKSEEFIYYLRNATSVMINYIKEAFEEHMIHYGQVPKWELLSSIWDQIIEKKLEPSQISFI